MSDSGINCDFTFYWDIEKDEVILTIRGHFVVPEGQRVIIGGTTYVVIEVSKTKGGLSILEKNLEKGELPPYKQYMVYVVEYKKEDGETMDVLEFWDADTDETLHTTTDTFFAQVGTLFGFKGDTYRVIGFGTSEQKVPFAYLQKVI